MRTSSNNFILFFSLFKSIINFDFFFEGISKLLSILRNLGVDDTLKEMGLEDGDIVTLCDFEFEYFK